MNKFVKGAKNLVLALSFVSVCACSSVENADLSDVYEKISSLEDSINKIKESNVTVKENKEGCDKVLSKDEIRGVILGEIDKFKQEVKENCIRQGYMNCGLLYKIGYNLSGYDFIVSKEKDIKIVSKEKDFKYNGFIVFTFKGEVMPFLEFIACVSRCGGRLQVERDFEKIKISFAYNYHKVNPVIIIDDETVETTIHSVIAICLLGELGYEVFIKLFECMNVNLIGSGKVDEKNLNGFWKEMGVDDDGELGYDCRYSFLEKVLDCCLVKKIVNF